MVKYNNLFTKPIWLIIIFTGSIGFLWIIESLITVLKAHRSSKAYVLNSRGKD